MFRRGSFTSPAVKVMLFQASDGKQRTDLRHANGDQHPKRAARGRDVARNDRSDLIGDTPRRPKFVKFALSASALRPTNMPSTISASSAKVFADVKMFWIELAELQAARVHKGQQRDHQDRDQLLRRKADRVVRERIIGGMIHCVGDTHGTNTPRNRANPTATAAIVPV